VEEVLTFPFGVSITDTLLDMKLSTSRISLSGSENRRSAFSAKEKKTVSPQIRPKDLVDKNNKNKKSIDTKKKNSEEATQRILI